MKKLTRQSLDELAKMLPVIEKNHQLGYVGGGNGTSADPYTMVEYESMLSGGNWNGGYVEGMGYANSGNDIYIYGNSEHPGQTSQEYSSFPDYITSLSNTGLDKWAEITLGSFPVIGSVAAYASQEYGNMTRDIQFELMNKGYGSSSSFNLVTTKMGDSCSLSVYDAASGEFITSRTYDSWGWK